MWFSRQLSAGHLTGLCHILRHSVEAGVPLTKVFRQQATRGPAAVRPVAGRIAAHLERGHDLRTALKDERHTFPPLFVALAGVGEETGSLPEVFAELEKYFLLQQKLQRQFRAQAVGPLLLWGVAVVVFALVMVVLGALGPGAAARGPTVFGAAGVGGAALFVAANVGCLFGVVLLYLLVTRVLGRAAG